MFAGDSQMLRKKRHFVISVIAIKVFTVYVDLIIYFALDILQYFFLAFHYSFLSIYLEFFFFISDLWFVNLKYFCVYCFGEGRCID